MADQMDHRWGENDHDRLIRQDELLKGALAVIQLQNARIEILEKNQQTANLERAKLIGWCGGVAAAVSAIVKYFLPGHA